MTNVNLQIAGSTGTTVTSATIANGPLSGNWEVSRSGAILSVDADLTDPDGIDSLTYTWYKIIDGVKSYVDTGTSFNIDPDQGPKTQVGTKFSLEIAYRDDKGDTDTYTIDDIIIRNHDHTTWDVNPASLVTEYYGVGTLGSLVDADIRVKAEHAGEVSVSGQTLVGQTLTASTADITDDDGKPETGFTYVWEKSRAGDGVIWQSIGGQASQTLTLNDSLAGYIIRSRVEFKDLRGSQEISYSKATNVVLPLTPLELVGNYEFASQKIHSGNEASTLDQGNINRFEGDTLRIFDSVHAKDGRAVTKTVQWYKWGAYESPDTLATMSADCEPGTYYAVVTLTDINGQTKSLTSNFVTITSQNLVLPASVVTKTNWNSYYEYDTKQQSELYQSSYSYLQINHENLPFPEKSASYYVYTSLDNGNTWQRSHYYQYPNWHYDLSVGNEFSIGAWYKVTAENGLYHAESAPTYVAGGEDESRDHHGVSISDGMIELSYANSVLTIEFEDQVPEVTVNGHSWDLWASYDGVNFLTKIYHFGYGRMNDGLRQGLFNLAYTPEPGVSLIVTGTQHGLGGYNPPTENPNIYIQTLHSNVLQLIELDPPQNQNHAPISYDEGGALLKIGSEDISPLNHFKEGKVLYALVNFGDADGFASSLDYTWRVSGVIVGYGGTLQLTAGMQGKTVTLEGSYTDKLDHLENVQAAHLSLDGNTPPVITRSLNLDLIDDQWHLITLADLQGKDTEDGEYAERLTFSTTALPAGLSFFVGKTPPVGSGSASSFTLKDIIQDKVWVKADVPPSTGGAGLTFHGLPITWALNDLPGLIFEKGAAADITERSLNDSQFVDLNEPADITIIFDESGKVIMYNDKLITESDDKKGFMTKLGDGVATGLNATGKGTLFGLKWVGGKLFTGLYDIKDGLVWTAEKSVDGLATGLRLAVKPVDWSIAQLWDNPWQIGPVTDDGINFLTSVLKKGVTLPLNATTEAIDTFVDGYKQWATSDLTGVFKVDFDNNDQLDGDGTRGLLLNEDDEWVWDKTTYSAINAANDSTLNKNHSGDQVHLDRLGVTGEKYSFEKEKNDFVDLAGTAVVFINGQANALTTASQLALYHGNTLKKIKTIEAHQTWKPGPDSGEQPKIDLDSVVVFHNETGGASDVIESSLLKLMPQTTVMVKHIADLIEARIDEGKETLVIGHSQGGILLTNALIELNHRDADNSKQGKYGKLTTEYHGSAANVLVAKIANDALGSKFFGMTNHTNDFVGVILGGTVNPLSWGLSLLSAPLLGGFYKDGNFMNVPDGWGDIIDSPHTLYPRMSGSEPWWQTITNTEAITP